MCVCVCVCVCVYKMFFIFPLRNTSIKKHGLLFNQMAYDVE